MTGIEARGSVSQVSAALPLVPACAESPTGCPMLASAVSQALLRHVVATTGSAWGLWCVPQSGPAGSGEQFSVLWCDGQTQSFVLSWSGDEVRRIFGSVLASGLPIVCHEVPPAWRAQVAASVAASAGDWRSFLALALTDVGGSRAMLGLANRAGGYDLVQVEAWRQTLDALAAVSVVDLGGSAPVQVVERASRATSEFLSRMSHELRTPLNAILGFAQLLRADTSQPLSAAQRAKLEHIEQAGGHLMTIISDVLDLARLEAGGMALSLESLRVRAVIDDAVRQVTPQASATGVHLHGALLTSGSDPDAFYVRGDQGRLRQVLTNLLTNAIKYNLPGGSVKVGVARETAPQLGDCIAITVTDSGVGISPEQQARLFEPFSRPGAERGGVASSGVGLVIVRKLVELMGGTIAVQSEVGRGSSFTVRLPAIGSPAEPAAAQAVDGEPVLLLSEPVPDNARDERDGPHVFTVLYAEDNEVNVELVRQVMRMRPNYRLIVAHSGAQAIDLVRVQRPDVLLLDMHLGDMTGIDVVVALDREPDTAGIPRLALSADAMPEHIKAARGYGFETYLTKPLDVSALLASLDEFGAT